MAAVVTLENVSVRYLSVAEPAISDVSLRVEPGELLLLAGPPGCGKSTVMRLVNGLVPNAYRADIGGPVTVGGQDAKGLTIRQISQTVGTLLQNPGTQVVGHSVLADIAFGLENRGVPAGDILARVHGVARRLGIDESLLSAGTSTASAATLFISTGVCTR